MSARDLKRSANSTKAINGETVGELERKEETKDKNHKREGKSMKRIHLKGKITHMAQIDSSMHKVKIVKDTLKALSEVEQNSDILVCFSIL